MKRIKIKVVVLVLGFLSVFQTVVGLFITGLVISNVCNGGRLCGWNLGGLALGIGAIATGIVYGVWAYNTEV